MQEIGLSSKNSRYWCANESLRFHYRGKVPAVPVSLEEGQCPWTRTRTRPPSRSDCGTRAARAAYHDYCITGIPGVERPDALDMD
ncbi:hypothetical protein LWI28_026941 [Acer negundo]|uniref:Uncharacterized protein n=1 Tax=Acer negundo TaxID=4023 RepID=A0AAD5NKT5_ACENE|nr:hypothetical protein LWI28_026941 [Acer negundo]